jgi:hypothetical protein
MCYLFHALACGRILVLSQPSQPALSRSCRRGVLSCVSALLDFPLIFAKPCTEVIEGRSHDVRGKDSTK